MQTILDTIAEKTRERVAEAKRSVPLEALRAQAEALGGGAEAKNGVTELPFYKALKQKGISFICEAKKASPSKGIIAEEFPYVQIAREYEAAGAAAISVLTEPFYFQGSNEFLKEIREAGVHIPLLRKDFTVDEYMLYEAKTIGASAVLLICALLDEKALQYYLDITHSLGMCALVETHDETEIAMALAAGANIIGVNNRDLKTFTVDIHTSARLRQLVPPEIAFVSESGIRTAEDIAVLRQNGTDAVLVGETLMRSSDKRAELARLRGEKEEK